MVIKVPGTKRYSSQDFIFDYANYFLRENNSTYRYVIDNYKKFDLASELKVDYSNLIACLIEVTNNQSTVYFLKDNDANSSTISLCTNCGDLSEEVEDCFKSYFKQIYPTINWFIDDYFRFNNKNEYITIDQYQSTLIKNKLGNDKKTDSQRNIETDSDFTMLYRNPEYKEPKSDYDSDYFENTSNYDSDSYDYDDEYESDY